MKKVTLQDIADSLGVSRISVWKVFSGREGVSDNLRKQVIQKASELDYNFPKDFKYPESMNPIKKSQNISVVVSCPETSFFWTSMIHEVAKALSTENVNLIYTYLPSQIPEDYILPTQLTNGMIDGLIILNTYDVKAIQLLSKLSTPKVYLDTSALIPFDQLNGDLVLSTGKVSLNKIVEYLVAHNKTRIGFLGDPNYSRTYRERHDFLKRVLQHHQLFLNPIYCYSSSVEASYIDQWFGNLVDSKNPLPNALLCANDHIACNVANTLKIRGYQVPGDIFVSGFDGIPELSLSNRITSVQHYHQDIGLKLATQILYKIKNSGLHHELIYISSDIIWGDLLS